MSVDIVWDEMIIPIENGYIKYVREYVYDNEESLEEGESNK